MLLQEVEALFATSVHKPLQRPPHNPERAPIEFVFHRLKDKLREMHMLLTAKTLPTAASAILDAMMDEDFTTTFRHCGYDA